MIEPTYSTGEVSRMSGATLRQLQVWDEQGMFKTRARRGAFRQWCRIDVAIVQVVVDAKRKGKSLQQLRHSLDGIRRGLVEHLKYEGIGKPAYVCITTGARPVVTPDAARVIGAMTEATGAGIVSKVHFV